MNFHGAAYTCHFDLPYNESAYSTAWGDVCNYWGCWGHVPDDNVCIFAVSRAEPASKMNFQPA